MVIVKNIIARVLSFIKRKGQSSKLKGKDLTAVLSAYVTADDLKTSNLCIGCFAVCGKSLISHGRSEIPDVGNRITDIRNIIAEVTPG